MERGVGVNGGGGEDNKQGKILSLHVDSIILSILL